MIGLGSLSITDKSSSAGSSKCATEDWECVDGGGSGGCGRLWIGRMAYGKTQGF